jgi:hypothetical protein
MARTSGEIDIRALVQGFIGTLVAAVEQNTSRRIEAALLNGVGVRRRGPGRPPKNGLFALSGVTRGPSKPRAKQLCPVPGCKNPAAPVFGMVCAKHKDMPKAKIKEFREARRRAKARSSGKAKTVKPKARKRAKVKAKATTRVSPRPAPKPAPRPAPRPQPPAQAEASP